MTRTTLTSLSHRSSLLFGLCQGIKKLQDQSTIEHLNVKIKLKFLARVVPNPFFLLIHVIMTSFPLKLANFLALLTFTLFILTSLMVEPEFSNLGHSTSGTWATFRCIYDVTMQEQKRYQNCKQITILSGSQPL